MPHATPRTLPPIYPLNATYGFYSPTPRLFRFGSDYEEGDDTILYYLPVRMSRRHDSRGIRMRHKFEFLEDGIYVVSRDDTGTTVAVALRQAFMKATIDSLYYQQYQLNQQLR